MIMGATRARERIDAILRAFFFAEYELYILSAIERGPSRLVRASVIS